MSLLCTPVRWIRVINASAKTKKLANHFFLFLLGLVEQKRGPRACDTVKSKQLKPRLAIGWVTTKELNMETVNPRSGEKGPPIYANWAKRYK